MPIMISPLPDLVLYTRPGCGLCDEARAAINLLVADRAAEGLGTPRVFERNIDEDVDLHRAFFDRIPVIELGSGRLELAMSPARLRRLFADVLDVAQEPVPAATHGAPTRPDLT